MAESHIVAAGNTYNPSLIVLRQKGYELWIEEGEDQLLWNARKDGAQLTAHSPPELLGMVSLWESLGTGWNIQKPDLLTDIDRR